MHRVAFGVFDADEDAWVRRVCRAVERRALACDVDPDDYLLGIVTGKYPRLTEMDFNGTEELDGGEEEGTGEEEADGKASIGQARANQA